MPSNKRLYDPERATLLSPKSGRPITVEEAIQLGIIKREKVVYLLRLRLIRITELSLAEARDRGLVNLVTGFVNDPNTGIPVPLDEAFAKGWLDTGREIPFEKLVEEQIMQPQIFEMFCRKIGLKDDTGRELTLSEALFEGLIDPNTGQIRDRKTKLPIPLKEALAKGVITPEGAALLRGLLRITVSTATVTKTITRYVTVSSHGSQDAPLTAEDQTLQNAVQSGLLSPDTEWPKDMGDLAKRTPVTPEPIRRTEAHLVYDDTEDITWRRKCVAKQQEGCE
ncbi:hypothetical protein MRX96_030232 [Rhipicephalus microplus]